MVAFIGPLQPGIEILQLWATPRRQEKAGADLAVFSDVGLCRWAQAGAVFFHR